MTFVAIAACITGLYSLILSIQTGRLLVKAREKDTVAALQRDLIHGYRSALRAHGEVLPYHLYYDDEQRIVADRRSHHLATDVKAAYFEKVHGLTPPKGWR